MPSVGGQSTVVTDTARGSRWRPVILTLVYVLGVALLAWAAPDKSADREDVGLIALAMALLGAGSLLPYVLRRRRVPYASRLRAKTGTLTGVHTLSGIIAGSNGRYRYFSIMLNHHVGGDAAKVIDQIVDEIAKF